MAKRNTPSGMVAVGFQTLSLSNSTASGLNTTCIVGKFFHLSVETNDCRYRGDGTNPALTTGVLLKKDMEQTNFFDHPSFKNIQKFSPTSLSDKTVAKIILKAANSPRLEIIVPSVVRRAVWMKNTFPYFINPILGMAFRKQLTLRENNNFILPILHLSMH